MNKKKTLSFQELVNIATLGSICFLIAGFIFSLADYFKNNYLLITVVNSFIGAGIFFLLGSSTHFIYEMNINEKSTKWLFKIVIGYSLLFGFVIMFSASVSLAILFFFYR